MPPYHRCLTQPRACAMASTLHASPLVEFRTIQDALLVLKLCAPAMEASLHTQLCTILGRACLRARCQPGEDTCPGLLLLLPEQQVQ